MDFRRCLTLGHCSKDRNGQQWVKDDEQGGKRVDNFGKYSGMV